jgi:hypothetical protein
MLGVLFALIVRNPKLYPAVSRIRFRFLMVILILTLYLFWPLSHTLLGIVFSQSGLEIAKTYISLTVFILLVVAVTAERDGWINKVLLTPLLRRIGDLSYFAYLFHLAVFLLVSWIFEAAFRHSLRFASYADDSSHVCFGGNLFQIYRNTVYLLRASMEVLILGGFADAIVVSMIQQIACCRRSVGMRKINFTKSPVSTTDPDRSDKEADKQ